jgi:hypothetical protein
LIPPEQAAVAALLTRLTGAAPILTHISAVFVGRDDVFKLKKAVRLPYVDQSSLAAREALCRRELELNRPNAPGIYRDVVAVSRAGDGTLRIGGEGAPVEWLLRMVPVPAEDFLDAVAARGALDEPLLVALADETARLLAAAPVAVGVDSAGRMAFVLEGNLTGCREAGLDPARVEAIGAAMRGRLARIATLLAERAENGFVRRCHGDLHLGNLCLWEGKPVAFDALEFDEDYARIDTGYELAFLVMDLEARVGVAAANRVMNRVLALSGDTAMLAALPFWMAQRALVRAKLEPARGRDGVPYLAAAERYLREVPPRLVAIGGIQGTGKTWLARAVAPELDALHLRSDEIRKRRAGLAPEQRLPTSAYSAEESAAVHAEMLGAARIALAAGRSVVLDAMFLDPEVRAAARAAAGTAPFTGIWLEAPLDVLRARVASRTADASDATVDVLERTARADPGALDWHRVNAAYDSRTAVRALLALNRESGA